jgi:Zn-dependent protease/predicted transcriptional regulator
MFGKRIKLFKLFGFEVKVDLSWLILAFLVTWSLASALFPYYYKGLSSGAYWWMGIAGALGLFFSIVFHELFHSLVARRFGIAMKGITLFVFGGVAEMEDEPPSARAEFYMSLVGPISSIFLGFFFWGVYALGTNSGWSMPVTGVFSYLRWLNWALAGFNLLPAFPLDGGRVLRSALWRWKKNLPWATRISSQIGKGFGLALILLGVISIFRGAFIGGMWWVLIGFFMRSACQMSYQRILIRQMLEGESVRDFMKSDPVTVTSSIPISDLVENYVYKHHFKMYPVVDNGKLKGCISTHEIKEIPREEWSSQKVSDVAKPCSHDNSISPEADATKALSLMHRNGNSRLMVVDKDRLVGVVALKDLLRFLSLKLDLEGEELARKI